jgi:molecular chaperone IbpA
MFDLTPLYRSSIGFDRLARMMDEAAGFETPAYPPYNIERLGEDAYRITMAVAGFAPEDMSLEVKGQALTVTGRKTDKVDAKTEYLHQGIAARSFERRFQLADHVEVTGAEMDNGLLHIALKRVVPEALKPRTIEVKAADKPKTIETRKAA